MTSGTQILLLLDLSSANPLAPSSVEAMLPPQRRNLFTHSLTEFGVERSPPNQAPDWERAGLALARLVERAREREQEAGGPVEFFVAGRAPLPLFFELGHLLSKWATTTLLNQRPDKSWDVLPLGEGDPGEPRFFTVRTGLDTSNAADEEGYLGVFLSTHHSPDATLVSRFCESLGLPLAGLITAWAERKMLDRSRAKAAAHELSEILERGKVHYPKSQGVICFIAGPATLAFLAGRAVNPNIFGSIVVPNFESGAYNSAVSLPRPRQTEQPMPEKLKVLFLAAAPRDEGRLRLDQERRDIKDRLLKAGHDDKFTFLEEWAVRVSDVQPLLMKHKPDIVHISGHGSANGELVLENEAGEAHDVDKDAFAETFRVLGSCVRVVLLNTCHSSPQASLLADHIDFAVGMDDEIGDGPAIGFSAAFYHGLADGQTVQNAFDMARAQAGMLEGSHLTIPSLFSTRQDPATTGVLGNP